ncbi:MAG: hypothetical protein AAB533_02820 [Patescibacteria group bacterium]
MLFDLTLIAAGVSSSAVLWYRVSQKIPELVAISDDIIIDRLHEDSARVRVFILNARRYWRQREHHQFLLRHTDRALHRLHIMMMRADNGVVAFHKKVRVLLGETNGVNGAIGTSEVGPLSQPDPPSAMTPSPSHPRVSEVRRKRTHRAAPDEGAGVTQRWSGKD